MPPSSSGEYFIPRSEIPYGNPLETPALPSSSEPFTSEDVETMPTSKILIPRSLTPDPQTPSTSDSNADTQATESDIPTTESELPTISSTPSNKVEVQTPEFHFPQSSCGDSSHDGNKTWYPVFIDNGHLEKIRAQYCQDAIKTMRTNTNTPSIQVASFAQRDKALRFAQAVGGAVGQPTKSETQILQSENNTLSSASQKTQLQSTQTSEQASLDNSGSQPQSAQVANTSNKDGSFMPVALILAVGCLLFGYRRLRNNKT